MLAQAIHLLRAVNPQARLFFAVTVGMSFVVDGLVSVLLNLYLLRLGYGTEFIGLVNAVGLLTFGFASLPAGILGSRMSVTRLMKFGAFTSLLGGLLLPLAEFLPQGPRELGLILPPALMFGGFAFFFVNGAAYLINVVDAAYKNHAFALKAAHWALAGFFGALAGGFLPGLIANGTGWTLNDPMPYRVTIALSVSVLALAALLSLRIRPLPITKRSSTNETASPGAPKRKTAAASVLMLIAIMSVIRLLQMAGSATAMVFFNVYMDQQLAASTALIGTVTALGRLTGVPTALLTPFLVERWGNIRVVIGASLVVVFFLLPLALVEHWLSAALGYVGVIGMMSVRYTAFIVYSLDLVPRAHQALMAGMGEGAAGLSFAMMALGGGFVLGVFSFRDLFLVGAALSLLGTAIFWWHCRREIPRRSTPTIKPLGRPIA